MDASSQTRKGASSQESLDDKNDICLRGLFKIPPLAPRPAGGTHTFSAAILPMPVSPPCLHWAHGNTLWTGPACRDGQLMNPIFKIYLKGDGRIAAVRYRNLFIFLTK
jgi:hypothetical protein